MPGFHIQSAHLDRAVLVLLPAEHRLRGLTAAAPPTDRPAIAAPPQSQLLGRLQTFLPSMAAANAQLEQEAAAAPAGAFDIEQLAPDEEQHIAFDLACGVLELKDDAAVRAAERAIALGSVPVETLSGGSSSDQDTSLDEGSSGGGSEAGSDAAAASAQEEDSGCSTDSREHAEVLRQPQGDQQTSSRQQTDLLLSGGHDNQENRRAQRHHKRPFIEVLP